MSAIVHPFVSAKDDGDDPSIVQPSHWNAEHSFTGLLTCVRPEEYGTVTGIDDNTIVGAAIAAAGGLVPVVFTSGKTYCFNDDAGALSVDGTHIIIESGATIKAKPDGGAARLAGLFYLSGANMRIENYGTIDGNNSAQTDDYSASSYNGLITSYEPTCINFCYADHGVGRITNCAYNAIILYTVVAPTIDGCNIDNCNLQTNFNGAAAIYVQGSPKTRINDVRITGTPAWGVRLLGTAGAGASEELSGFEVSNLYVDLRGIIVPDSVDASGGGLELNTVAIITGPVFTTGSISNVKVYAPDSAAGAVSIIAGLSCAGSATVGLETLTLSNIEVRGTAGQNSCFTYGIECGTLCAELDNILIHDCETGILCGGVSQHIRGTITGCRGRAIHLAHGGQVDLDLIVKDCGKDSPNAAIYLQNIDGVPDVTIKVRATFVDMDEDVFLVSGTGKVTIHDSVVTNSMAGSRTVNVSLTGNGASITNSQFIGKGDVGSCIILTGTGNRILGNHFKDYAKPWDTGGGTNSLIETNLVESCTTPAGTTAGTDTVANNKAF